MYFSYISEKSNLRGDPVSPANRNVKKSDKETPSKREASPLLDPEVEPKMPKLDAESKHKGGSWTATEELHVVDESDGSRWTIRDKTVIDLLKRYNSAPDQKTKDEIVKHLQSYVASLKKNSKISQGSKHSSNKCSSHQPPMPKAADLSKIAKNLQKWKPDDIPQAPMSSSKIQASRSDKQLQGSKKGGTEGDLDGNRMDVDKKSRHHSDVVPQGVKSVVINPDSPWNTPTHARGEGVGQTNTLTANYNAYAGSKPTKSLEASQQLLESHNGEGQLF